jgi:hypothetical protein
LAMENKKKKKKKRKENKNVGPENPSLTGLFALTFDY